VAAGVPSGRLKPATPGIGFTPASTKSCPVITASTPGIALAAELSIERITAWGIGERKNLSQVWPVMLASPANNPWPCTKLRSSIRRRDVPDPNLAASPWSTTVFIICSVLSLLGCDQSRSLADRLNNIHIACATAKITLDGMNDLFVARCGVGA